MTNTAHQPLWPFVASRAGVRVGRWEPDGAPGEPHALVLTGADLPRTTTVLANRLAEARSRLAHDGAIALLADNPWRAALAGRTHTGPSLPAMATALRRSRWHDLRWYAVTPSAASPYTLRPVGALRACWAGSVMVSARPAAAAPPLAVDALLARLSASGTLGRHLRLWRALCSGKDKLLLFLGDRRPRWIARLPASAAALEAERRAHRLLGELGSRPGLAAMLPRPVIDEVLDGQAVLVETLVGGRPLARLLDRSNRSRYAGEAARFLGTLNPAAASACDDPMARFARPLLDRVAPHLPERAMLAPLHAALAQALAGVRCRVGTVHGDFGTKNIMVDGGRIVGVIDWENAETEAPLVLDLMGYLDSADRRVHRGQTLADTVPRIAAGQWREPVEAALLAHELAAGGADAGALRGLAMLYWLAHVTPQLAFGAAGEADRQRFEQVLRWAIATAANPP